jgi:GTPase SAR1 family protein
LIISSCTGLEAALLGNEKLGFKGSIELEVAVIPKEGNAEDDDAEAPVVVTGTRLDTEEEEEGGAIVVVFEKEKGTGLLLAVISSLSLVVRILLFAEEEKLLENSGLSAVSLLVVDISEKTDEDDLGTISCWKAGNTVEDEENIDDEALLVFPSSFDPFNFLRRSLVDSSS